MYLNRQIIQTIFINFFSKKINFFLHRKHHISFDINSIIKNYKKRKI